MSSTTWLIDPVHTSVEFAVKHLMIATVKGRFADVQGSVILDGDDYTTAVVDVTARIDSIDTRMPDRDAHLKSADFFNAEQYPTLAFRSNKAERAGDEIRLTGDLTIRGITRQVVLLVTPQGTAKDPWGNQKAGFSATTRINRQDFGLVWNAALETGGVVVGDEVRITIDVELMQQVEKAAA